MILEVLINGWAVYSFKPKEDIQDLVEPIKAVNSEERNATEDADETQQICERKNETIRPQMKQVADHVSALTQQR